MSIKIVFFGCIPGQACVKICLALVPKLPENDVSAWTAIVTSILHLLSIACIIIRRCWHNTILHPQVL